MAALRGEGVERADPGCQDIGLSVGSMALTGSSSESLCLALLHIG